MENGNISVETSNINQMWLSYLLENFKNLENMERNAHEGCLSLMDYFQIPFEMRNIILPDVQYKNLRFMVTEIGVILGELEPVVDKESFKKFKELYFLLARGIDERKLFVVDKKNNGTVIYSELTQFFYKTLETVVNLKMGIIGQVGHIFYIKNENENRPKW